mmetsp:Transcript_60519/g.118642  ORF Transcript_60519/g.118642 Transcript_60519/m.118642 type:complete len:216 (+) Transcript_60519:946-1593(+)
MPLPRLPRRAHRGGQHRPRRVVPDKPRRAAPVAALLLLREHRVGAHLEHLLQLRVRHQRRGETQVRARAVAHGVVGFRHLRHDGGRVGLLHLLHLAAVLPLLLHLLLVAPLPLHLVQPLHFKVLAGGLDAKLLGSHALLVHRVETGGHHALERNLRLVVHVLPLLLPRFALHTRGLELALLLQVGEALRFLELLLPRLALGLLSPRVGQTGAGFR